MPPTLSADLAFNSSKIAYGFGLVGLSWLACTKLTPSQAASINGTYTLTRETGRLTSEFFFELAYGPLCIYSVSTSNVTIRVGVGIPCGATNSGLATLQNVNLSFKVPATATDEFAIPWNGSTDWCEVPTRDAASKDYVNQVELMFPSTWGYRCIKPSGEVFDLRTFSLYFDPTSTGTDYPQCEPAPIKVIDHQWAYDVLYTDTSGSSVSVGRLPRALTLRVRDVS